MKTFLLGLILTTTAYAEVFRIAGKMLEFENKDGLLVKGCSKSCDALDTVAKFKKIDLKKARAQEKFVGSAGSDVCRLVYKANSLIGVNQDKDQRAFCVFKDESLIETNSLSQYLLDKKIITE